MIRSKYKFYKKYNLEIISEINNLKLLIVNYMTGFIRIFRQGWD